MGSMVHGTLRNEKGDTMKKTISVTVNADAWLMARTKVPNLSAYISQCLESLSGTGTQEYNKSKLSEDIEAINNTIMESSIKKSILEMEMKKIDEKIIETKRIQKDNEQYKRWVCPVDQQTNAMDSIRCCKCNLPTSKSSKVTYTFIKDGEVLSDEAK